MGCMGMFTTVMPETVRPILYSFRRCPYAMRARMALRLAGIEWEHREVNLKDKPQAMLAISPKGTVPVLELPDGSILEESLDILIWALEQKNLAGILSPQRLDMLELIRESDTDFKSDLDRYKYPTRYDDVTDPMVHREKCEAFLGKLDSLLQNQKYLFGDDLTFADIAIFPFIRQFSRVEEEWFYSLPYSALQRWLTELIESEVFLSIMDKHDFWQE